MVLNISKTNKKDKWLTLKVIPNSTKLTFTFIQQFKLCKVYEDTCPMLDNIFHLST